MKILSGLTKGQVLQRLHHHGASATLEIECASSETITVSLSQKGEPLRGWTDRQVGRATKGRLSIHLPDIPVGGPYRLQLRARRKTISVSPFYVGDVWLLAGQSNMQGAGNMDGAAKPDERIRAFSMRREWRLARDPLHVLEESPDTCHNGGTQFTKEQADAARKTVPKGIGPGLFFARDFLSRSGGVPQGLIATAHGGTSMSHWNPKRISEGPASLYFSMIQSVLATHQPIAGVLWYQGEGDASEEAAPIYRQAMKALITATRRDLNQPRLPWIVAQIGRYAATENSRWWNTIQEYQRCLPATIPHVEVVPTVDLELDDLIHISSRSCAILGARMASVAARLVLRDRKQPGQPRLHKIGKPVSTKYGWHMDVEFSDIEGSLHAEGQAKGFAFVDSNHNIDPKIYRIETRGPTVRLYLTGGNLDGVKLGYGMTHDPVCNIFDDRGFSLPVFGPVTTPRALLPFVTGWRKTDLLPATNPLTQLECLTLDGDNSTISRYDDTGGFINEGPVWQGRAGQAFFSSTIRLTEPMKLKFLIGYDGPIRLWVSGVPLFQDMKGTNPCIADAKNKVLALDRGDHVVTLAMDTNSGKAWGFFLRFERMGLSQEACRKKTFTKPEYLI